MLANHGPVVAGVRLKAAIDAMEESEETAKLMLLTQGMARSDLTQGEVAALVQNFEVDWDN